MTTAGEKPAERNNVRKPELSAKAESSYVLAQHGPDSGLGGLLAARPELLARPMLPTA